MAQAIRNVKIGDKFVVNNGTPGFEYGVIVKSLDEELNISNDERRFIKCVYVSGESSYKSLELWQKTVDLKKYRRKIK